MENQVDLQTNYINEKCKNACKQLSKHYSSEKGLLLKLKRALGSSETKVVEVASLLGNSTVKLSKNALEMALILVNGFPELRSNQRNSYYWIYQETVDLFSKRYAKFNELYKNEDLWCAEYEAVLEYFYGKERVKYIQQAWHKIPELAYQSGYYRRSFRAPHLTYTTRVNQLNFLIQLNIELSYNLDMETYIINDHALYTYGSNWKAHVWAAAIDAGDEAIFQLLLDIVYQRHPKGKVSRQIIKALLLSTKEEAWKAVKDLLLSAQRQEGLRQTILECLDETSLGAMKYLIEVILEHNLTRFSSVVRAVDTWAGLGWEGAKQSTVKRFLEAGSNYLNNPELIPNAIKDKDNTEVYMALWAQGVLDVEQCYPFIQYLWEKGTIEKRCLALYFANQTQVGKLELEFAEEALKEENLKLLYWGLRAFNSYTFNDQYLVSNARGLQIFRNIEGQLERIPKKGKSLSNMVFSWLSVEIHPSMAYKAMLKLIDATKEEDVRLILPHFSKMSVADREQVTQIILPTYYPYYNNDNKKNKGVLTPFQREFAFTILTDRGQLIRDTGMNALKNAELNDEEVQQFELLLKRKSAATRKSVIQLILKKDKPQIIASTERLVASKSIDQRLAGLDILNQVYTDETLKDWTVTTAQKYQERPTLTEAESILLQNIVNTQETRQEYTWENGLGLYDPLVKTAAVQPKKPSEGEYVERTKKNPLGLSMPAKKIENALKELHDLVQKYQDYEYEVQHWGGQREVIVLGNQFRQISNDLGEEATREEHIQNYPLSEVWLKWYEDAKLTPCDLFLLNQNKNVQIIQTKSKVQKQFECYTYYPNIPKIGTYYWQNPIYKILELLVYAFPYQEKMAFLKGLIAQLMAVVPKGEIDKAVIEKNRWQTNVRTWRDLVAFSVPYNAYKNNSIAFSDEAFKSYWKMEHWCKSTLPKEAEEADYLLPQLIDVARAYELNLITIDELYHRVLKPDAIRLLTQRNKHPQAFNYLERFPFLADVLKKCRDRILEIELARGDSSTLVTPLAQSLSEIYGIHNFVQIFKALGKESLNRGYVWSGSDYSKKQILSELLKSCKPLKTETQQDFNELVKEAKLSDKRLIEAAVYAQQWIPFVSTYLKWKGLDSAIWWLHAHTNAYHTAETETEIAKYSKVQVTDFKDGAVDTEWFKAAYKNMGKAKWKVLYDAAKYISDGRGHKRAQLYADVILGNTKIKEVTQRVKEKRNQDYLRVYGLVPLSRANREKDLLKRYQYLQQFKKESKQFGSQRQASEGLAVRIAMDNLARTAGYSDPIRLTWAMEAAEAHQIMEKAKRLTFGAVEIYLTIDELGKSSIVCEKQGKKLNAIPAKLRKEKAVVELKAFNKTLRNQYTRTRKSLEEAMVNGDAFTTSEIQNLLQHPVVEPMLKKLVLKSNNQLGFATTEGLKSVHNKKYEWGETVWIAHCSDLYQDGDWSAYQRYCFDEKIKQPFKQIFRELYLATPDELKERTISRRYAGHQVQPKKTVALLKTRGWTVDYEEGLQKVYHKEGIIAKMYAMADWFSPADVESPTLETVEFFNRKTYKPVAFEDLEPRLFSEVMRDIDLVVSVAHVGGVDPEASHSTIEMRAVLVEETARLFKLKNVSTQKHHVYIDGTMGRYTVHLGSAVCHKIPGRYLSILPVHSQHRGRLFLPFVDDDPRSAELMSKVLLLAKDDKIQDPTVLSQIYDKVENTSL
ncbi:DUF4132 domain-containing protein [Aureispira sp. CCB-E]|uniref:DUF4132 domain-containing protein n=1 Tax=Aureispira sp. CCB-E TaxID=3051121 RepID=UPI0028687F77|nr:DUF4132 domain-containing protein [Aureispira sp. CCB-E]WMX17358.1 DUF4132 domain-containing protein [Aureispira sp. CCB-E]